MLSSPTREHSNSPRSRETPTCSMSEEEEEGEADVEAETSTLSSSSSSSSPSLDKQQQQEEKRMQVAVTSTNNNNNNNGDIPKISSDVAFVKLEQKFSQAMDKIATLVTEKEYLEHLNVQLQEETETVGEHCYVYVIPECYICDVQYNGGTLKYGAFFKAL